MAGIQGSPTSAPHSLTTQTQPLQSHHQHVIRVWQPLPIAYYAWDDESRLRKMAACPADGERLGVAGAWPVIVVARLN